jgi:2-methylisocitrate lyase-like PEP mutase family enzyme
MSLLDLAETFRRLHVRGTPLVLPNAWDAGSARVIEAAGARAIATSSSGASWSLGRPDGEGTSRDEMLAVVRRVARAVSLPVTADVERGYGDGSPADVADTVRGVLDAGAVGVNLEDGEGPGALTDEARQTARVAAAREAADAAGVPLYVNARVDSYLFGVGAPETRFDETVRRARAYLAAGADVIFVPGVIDAETIGRLASAIDAPLNVLARPGAPTIPELGALGVARVSLGGGVARAALGAAWRVATEVLQGGTYEALGAGVPIADMNALFR